MGLRVNVRVKTNSLVYYHEIRIIFIWTTQFLHYVIMCNNYGMIPGSIEACEHELEKMCLVKEHIIGANDIRIYIECIDQCTNNKDL
jgi:hypothetical protein